MSVAERMHFLQDVFQMTAIALVSVINDYYTKGLHLFWDTLYLSMFTTKNTYFHWFNFQHIKLSSGMN